MLLTQQMASILPGGAVLLDPKGTTDDTFYAHYSILSTLENNRDLPNLGRYYDISAGAFKLAADMTGYKNQAYDISTVDQSIWHRLAGMVCQLTQPSRCVANVEVLEQVIYWLRLVLEHD
jgi:hypothetical protein